MFMFDTQVGLFSWYLGLMGWKWDHLLNDTQAMAIVVVAATWSRISYNYLFFLTFTLVDLNKVFIQIIISILAFILQIFLQKKVLIIM